MSPGPIQRFEPAVTCQDKNASTFIEAQQFYCVTGKTPPRINKRKFLLKQCTKKIFIYLRYFRRSGVDYKTIRPTT